MRTSDKIDLLATALAKAQSEMKNAVFNKVNPHFKSKYADLGSIRDAVIPALTKNGIAVAQGTTFLSNQWCVVTSLIHSSGQYISSDYPFALDKPQAMGSAYTYARRYSLAAICGIASEEDDDANAANEKPVMLGVNGTVGASKGSQRIDFDNMIKSIRNSFSLATLTAWYQRNITAIEAMPPDWVDELRTEYVDKISELKKDLKV
jgi:hypothetical protein